MTSMESTHKFRVRRVLGMGMALTCAVAAAQTDEQARAATAAAAADEAIELDKVVVQGRQLTPVQESQDRLKQVAGSVHVVNNAEVEKGRAANAEDVLAYQPGVYAEATSGSFANKISIRGSGLNTFYQGYSLGLTYLYDGLPVTGPGGTQEDHLNIAAVSATEILNGSNAFQYSALSLGGAINFITHNGHTSPGWVARLEAGSKNYRKVQISKGGVIGNFDYYLSAQTQERDGVQTGYRPASQLAFPDPKAEGKAYVANLGYRFNHNFDSRLILRYRESETFNGSTLTRAQLEADPTQTNSIGGRLMPGTWVISNINNWWIDDKSKLEFGFNYNNFPLDNGYVTSATPQFWKSHDLSGVVRYLRKGDKLFGKPSDTTVSLTKTYALDDEVRSYTRTTGALSQYTKYSGSGDTVLSAANNLAWTDKLTFTTGLAFANIVRDVRILETALNTNNPYNYPKAVRNDEWFVLPRVGFTYQANDALQYFGNVGNSVDSPVTWQMGSTGSSFVRPLQPQKGTTLELGLRGGDDRLQGSLAIYRSWIRGELLNVILEPSYVDENGNEVAAVIANFNASKTIHQGIEAGLTAVLWKNEADRLTLRQSYTLNDFKYVDDPGWGSNRLPSIPTHVYQGELQYQFASGFYAGLSVRAASSYYVDFANTWKAKPYALLGARFGYEAPSKKYSLFLDLRNLQDKHYAATANTTSTATPSTAAFYPGDGFNAVVGVSFRF